MIMIHVRAAMSMGDMPEVEGGRARLMSLHEALAQERFELPFCVLHRAYSRALKSGSVLIGCDPSSGAHQSPATRVWKRQPRDAWRTRPPALSPTPGATAPRYDAPTW